MNLNSWVSQECTKRLCSDFANPSNSHHQRRLNLWLLRPGDCAFRVRARRKRPSSNPFPVKTCREAFNRQHTEPAMTKRVKIYCDHPVSGAVPSTRSFSILPRNHRFRNGSGSLAIGRSQRALRPCGSINACAITPYRTNSYRRSTIDFKPNPNKRGRQLYRLL